MDWKLLRHHNLCSAHSVFSTQSISVRPVPRPVPPATNNKVIKPIECVRLIVRGYARVDTHTGQHVVRHQLADHREVFLRGPWKCVSLCEDATRDTVAAPSGWHSWINSISRPSPRGVGHARTHARTPTPPPTPTPNKRINELALAAAAAATQFHFDIRARALPPPRRSPHREMM